MSDRLLTDEQLTQAVELFAQGQNRTQVTAHFIDNDPDIRQAEATTRKDCATPIQRTASGRPIVRTVFDNQI